MGLKTNSILQPALIVADLDQINLSKFWNQGKRGIILDLDNTITPWKDNTITGQAQTFIEKALKQGYKICLISNASRSRTEKIAAIYNIPFVAPAFKPFKKPFILAMQKLQLNNEQVLVVGDQIFTDVLGGNRANLFTILVPPLDEKEFIWTKFMRTVEKLAGRKTDHQR